MPSAASKPRQGHMRMPFAAVWTMPKPDHRTLYPPLDSLKRIVLLDSRPQHLGLAARREMSHPLQGKGEGLPHQSGEGRFDLFVLIAVDVPNEP